MKMEVVGFVEEVLEEVGHLLSNKPAFAVWWKKSLGLERPVMTCHGLAVWWKQSLGLKRLVMTCLSELLGVLGVLVEEVADWCS